MGGKKALEGISCPMRIPHAAYRVSLLPGGFRRQNKSQIKDVPGSQKGKLWLVFERELEVGRVKTGDGVTNPEASGLCPQDKEVGASQIQARVRWAVVLWVLTR